MQQSLSLFDFNEYLRRVVALNFPDLIWIHCEIAQANTSRGHLYLQLIQKDNETDEIIAQSSAVIWERNLRQILKKYGQAIFDILTEGMAVSIQVKANYHERYGFSLQIEDIDTNYTIGKLALQRRQVLEKLQKEGLLLTQKKHMLSPVLQRIAVISSDMAAGWLDFKLHLQDNNYDYHYKLTLYNTSVQGTFAPREIIAQLENVELFQADYDVVVIVRGGGSKTDLIAFDDEQLCRKVASFPLPVIIGIGHEIDETVLDFVSARSLKTPTAVADFLLEHNINFERSVLLLRQNLGQYSMAKKQYNQLLINDLSQKLNLFSLHKIQQGKQQIALSQNILSQNIDNIIIKQKQTLAFSHKLIESYNPKCILQRGFTLARQDGKVISKKRDFDESQSIEIEFGDGKITIP